MSQALVQALRSAPAGLGAATGLLPPGSVAVVTGQQPALGGGPLYTLVKSAAAVALARAVSAAGRPCAPVFWCASEDHDLGEAGHADLLRRDGSVVRVAADLGPGRASLRFRSASSGWADLLAALRREVGPGLGEAFVQANSPRGDEDLGAWCCRFLATLFPGLVTIEAHRLRPFWGPQMALAIDAWPTAALAGLRRQLLADGAEDPFGTLADPPLFADRRDGRMAVDRSAARQLLAAAPADLSPGAALRPVLQQAALPAIAYVGGPGELAYHRFITPVYGALGVERPLLILRPSATLVPGWLRRGLAAHGLTPDRADQAPAEPPPADDPLVASLALAIDRLEAARPGLAGGVRRLRREVTALRRSARRQAERQAGRPALGPLRAWLSPRGGRQERTMSLIQAVWTHGPGIAGALVAALADAAPGEHRFIDV